MPLIAQVCMVAVTIALVAFAIVAIRVMLYTETTITAANRSLAELPALIQEAKLLSARSDDVLLAISRIARSAQTGVSQFERVATRSATLASSVLDEVDGPISQTIGVIRGIRAGVGHLIQLWQSRVASSHTNQGDNHVGEQRGSDGGGIPDRSGGRGWVGADLRTRGW